MNIDEDYHQDVLTALLWLAFSERPLRIDEHAEATAINPQPNLAFDPEERLPDPRNVLQILTNLVTFSSKDDVYESPRLVI
jgi:hypothetical protein